jgi:hypothetical protein
MGLTRFARDRSLPCVAHLLGMLAMSWFATACVAGCGGAIAAQPGTMGGSPEDVEASQDGSQESGAESCDSTAGHACGVDDASVERSCVVTDAVGADGDASESAGLSGPVCHTVYGWGWDGAKCFAVVGCVCQGVDCGRLSPVPSACWAAYGHCAVQD